MVAGWHAVAQQWAALPVGAAKIETDGKHDAFEVPERIHDLDWMEGE
jgi:hypothetical protein